MTSINAIKFNEHCGLMICDEERHWNEEGLKIHAAYKIRPCIPREIQLRYGLVAAYGNTGTSTIGDELKKAIRDRVAEEYHRRCERLGKRPREFITIEELARLAFEVIVRMKRTHIDQELKAKFGFCSDDYVRGFYEKEGKKVEINNPEVAREVQEYLTWSRRGQQARAVHLNAGIVAGWEPKEGFRIFHISMIDMFCRPVQEIFLAEGSGLDQANVVLADYLSYKSVPERRGNIEPAEGAFALISAVNRAARVNLGVGGYYNIIYFNGRAPRNTDKMVEISDHRSHLASEIVDASENGYLARRHALEMLSRLIFHGESFEDVHGLFWKRARQQKKLRRHLRGYRVR
jgi:hypothetical protein